MAERPCELADKVAIEIDREWREGGGTVSMARAAVRTVLERAIAAVEVRTLPGSEDYSLGWHDGVERSAWKLRAMLAALDG